MNRNALSFTCRFTLVLLTLVSLLSPIGGAWAGAPDEDILPGRVIFKIAEPYQVDMPLEGAERFGYEPLDRLMDEIEAVWVVRKFPHCLPPQPGGVDLTRQYVLEFPSYLNVETVAYDLSFVPGIEYTQPWFVNRLFFDHNDSFRNRQWALDIMDVNEAHDICAGSEDVVIAISDNGTDMDHEDLVDNIWENPNDAADGQDNDGNGHRDDVHGWDFTSGGGGDNDPNDDVNHGHGTHTAGIASAVTNNQLGVASVAFSCKLMIVRCGRGERITAGYESIEYAASNGAHIINCSWGGTRTGASDREVIDYAEEHDVMVVCAAGNSNTSTRNYPAGYDWCVAVAATNQNDNKCNFSSYGDWVDISAPGIEIYSTTVNNDYRMWEGTSMASPYVASTAALIKSEYPEMDVAALKLFLFNGVEELDDNRLGAGRVNAFLALRAMEYPVLQMRELALVNESNGNQRVDPGDRAEFTLRVSNFGREATDITATLSSEDEDISFEVSEVSYPDLATGASAVNTESPFIFSVARNSVSHSTKLRVHLTAQPHDIEIDQEFELLIGHPAVLVIDDDDGGEYEQVFNDALVNLRLGYQRWDVLMTGLPKVDQILTHPIIIWITGDAYPPLDNGDLHTLRELVSEGANILLMGKSIGDIATPENQSFLRTSFGVYHEDDSVFAETARGMPGNAPVPSDVVIRLGEPGDTLSGRLSPSSSSARLDADTLMVYEAGGRVTGGAGIYWHHRDTNARTIYLGYALEMSNDAATPRSVLLGYMLDWLTDYHAVPGEAVESPVTYQLSPAFPNPFNSRVTLSYSLPQAGLYRLVIVDPMGREVARVFDGEQMPGSYRSSWDAAQMPSGVYFARMEAVGSAPIERQLILVK